jgi:hypothetical protein
MDDYPTDIVWACAVAADRINNGYRKESRWDRDDLIEKPSNKRLVFEFLEDYRNNKLVLLDDDYTEGQAVREYWQTQTLILLDENANNYIRSVVKAAHNDTFNNIRDISLIVSCISAKRNNEQRQKVLEIKNNLHSQHVYAVRDKIRINDKISVIDSKFIDNIGASAVECIVQGNLYMWWSKRHVNPGDYSYLVGRVKRLTEDYFTNQLVTHLNYVSIATKDKE